MYAFTQSCRPARTFYTQFASSTLLKRRAMYFTAPSPESQTTPIPYHSYSHLTSDRSSFFFFYKAARNLVHASTTLGPNSGPSFVAEGCSCASASVKAARERTLQSAKRVDATFTKFSHQPPEQQQPIFAQLQCSEPSMQE